ncbi:MAG: translocation protein TolB [Pedosphaera sp.]|nr:translocation protein TolB [Pedosphaera sp.]
MRAPIKFLFIALLLAAISFPAVGKPPKKTKAQIAEEKAEAKKMKVPPGQPEIFSLEPHGIQRGESLEIKLIGTNLIGLTELKFSNPKLTGELIRADDATTNAAWIKITVATNLARGSYEVSVKNEKAESSKLKLYVDDLPQTYESKTNKAPLVKLSGSFWGTLDPAGDTDEIQFEAKSGQIVILDVAAKSIGSKANAALNLFDEKGVLLASNNGFDGGDPLLNFKIPATGRYHVRITDEMAAGSKDHFYRLSMGSFAEVVSCYPLSVPANQESEVELTGFNLPPASKVRVKAGANGEVEVPVNAEQYRSRKTLKVLVGAGPELTEVEPNDTPEQAMKIPAPAAVNGRIWNSSNQSDADLFKFETKKGQRWIIETMAAQRGSPVDTKIEILQTDGRPLERLVLQAVRNSAINFRPVDSNGAGCRLDNSTEMELNEYYYMQGDVARLFRMPQGPDSDLLFYTSNGKRRAYFDTSTTTHALDEQGYIVEPHQPGEKLESNGLPVFPIYYGNDDDSERKLGTDSRVHFTAPADGTYLVRVTDTREFNGDRYAYRLVLREAKPDFNVTLNGANPTVGAGSGQGFSVSVERFDGFEDEIRVDITNLPAGFTASSPLVIEAGHTEAKGTVNASLNAMQPNETNAPMPKVTATAMVDGKRVTKDVNSLGKMKLGEKPKLRVFLETNATPNSTNNDSMVMSKPLELTLAPGQSIPAWLKVQRNGHEDLITFTVDNLPHGVIVDNIGLNGVLIPKGENERQIFLTSEKWVPDTDRLCYAVENQAGRQTSLPLMLHVRKTTAVTTAKAP